MSVKLTLSNKDGMVLYTKKTFVEDDIQLVLDEKLFPSGTVVITENGTHDVEKYTTAEINVDSRKPEQSKEVEYNKNGQYVVSPEEGYVLTDVKVAVNVPIPEGYIKPEGNIDITNTAEVDVTNYATAKVVDDNLTAENIAENVTVLGITGTFRGGIDTSDATATNGDLLLGKTAYANDQKLVGTIETYNYTTKEGSIPEVDLLIAREIAHYSNNRVKTIGERAMSHFRTLTSCEFKNVETLKTYAFYGCINLLELNFPSATTIETNAFTDCKAATIARFDSLVNIKTEIVRSLTAMKIVYIPLIESISGAPFADCTALEAVIITQTNKVATLAAANAFVRSSVANGTGYVYVPDELVEDYKEATN